MLKNYCEELYGRLMEDLQQPEEAGANLLVDWSVALTAVRASLGELKGYCLEYPFESPEEEIWFFKTGKPRFYQWLIFYGEYLELASNGPLLPGKGRLRYYRAYLRSIRRFFRQQEFFYRYYQLGATALDRFYFVRGAEVQGLLLPEMPEVDPSFGTVAGYLFARLMAYERLRDHVLELISGREPSRGSFTSKKGKALKWTGDSCNLIEIAYGIYDTLQINKGEVDLSDIIDWLESSLQVNLGRYYRRFMEIKRRKAMSKTRYLDEMREAVNKRIDDTDAYQAEKRRNFRNH